MNDQNRANSGSEMNSSIVEKPWSRSPKQVIEDLEVDVDSGLSEGEVSARRERHGSNKLRETQRREVWQILLAQCKNLVLLLLASAAVVAFLFGQNVEGFAIGAAIVINIAIGFFMEWQAVRSMESLRDLGQVESKVRRSGSVKEIPARELVPGDIVILEGGDVITADLRIIEANKLSCNESALTGESEPVEKDESSCDEDAPLAERTCMLYKGTSVTGGSGEGVVVATGMDTELGRISSLMEEVEEQEAPLEKRLDRLARRLIWLTLFLGAAIVGIGVFVGKDIYLIVETAIALAVATIPEGLPIVATVALARGMRRMSRRNALVRQLSAVETLGSTNVILTDKTGTLTENRMTVTTFFGEDGRTVLESDGTFKKDDETISSGDKPALSESIRVAVLCNNASLEEEEEDRASVGDPTEVALLRLGRSADRDRESLLDEQPEVREEAFNADVKMMATVHRLDDGDFLYAVKGAPEAVLEVCDQLRTDEGTSALDSERKEELLARNSDLAGEGLRLLALAEKRSSKEDENPYEGLTFLSLVGLKDPPREGIKEAIETCHQAGIRVVMITGDQRETAGHIAKAVGIIGEDKPQSDVLDGGSLKGEADRSEEEKRKIAEANIFARTSPEQKLTLLDLHRDSGSIVTMIGDGVNDAPALKKAHIGVAMGKRGTQVAREAADVILRDDEFSTIIVAIRQGRAIFQNIRKFVIFLLSGNLAEVLAVAIASIANTPLPILPLQILYLNMIIDVYPALALGFGEGESGIMKKPPRDPKESILGAEQWFKICFYGVVLAGAVLGALYLALNWLDVEKEAAVSISFLTLAFTRLWHVWNLRDEDSRLFKNEILRNPWVWAAVGICLLLIFGALWIPLLAEVLTVRMPSPKGWLVVLGMSLAPTIIVQIYLMIRGRTQ